MDYYHTDSESDISWLANVFATAALNGRSVRILTNGKTLKIKIGQGVWTAPFESTPDPYRDLSV